MSPKSTNFAPQKYNKNCEYANKIRKFSIIFTFLRIIIKKYTTMKTFKRYYLQLTGTRRRQFKRQVMQRTGWSNSTFYYKCEHANVTKLEDEVINIILNHYRNEDRAQQRFVEKYYAKQHQNAL